MTTPKRTQSTLKRTQRTLKLSTYAIVCRAIEEGLPTGITWLWKYHDGDTMTEQQMRDGASRIEDALINELCEVINFETEP